MDLRNLFARKSEAAEGAVAVAEPIVAEPIVAKPIAVKPAEPQMPSRGPAASPELGVDELAEYLRVASDIGINAGTITAEKLQTCLREENIHVYNNRQVVEYLDAKLGKDWEWQGLRDTDMMHLKGWHVDVHGARRVHFSEKVYRAAVPLPVLLTVQKVLKAVPEAHFYVSAPKEDDGDPFLLVTTRYIGNYVIERWDEPNFRER